MRREERRDPCFKDSRVVTALPCEQFGGRGSRERRSRSEVLFDLVRRQTAAVDRHEPQCSQPGPITGQLVAEREMETDVPIGDRAPDLLLDVLLPIDEQTSLSGAIEGVN